MERKYLAFDIETAADIPGTDFNWRPHRPIGITCAAIIASDNAQPIIWHGKTDVGQPAPRMSRDEAREIELMGAFGMPAIDALKAATSVDAKILHMDDRIGRVKEGLLADLIAVEGDPAKDVSRLLNVKFVMKNGAIYKQ